MKTNKTNKANESAKKVNSLVLVSTTTNQPEAANTAVMVAATAKVGKKSALKSLKVVAANTRTDRKGANATIRLIAERATSGCKDSINVLCALCDVPVDMVYTLDITKVRAAVNAYYPYFVTMGNGRRINVKIRSVHYTTPAQDTLVEASKRVIKGYFTDEESDYLNILARAARARICGIKQRELDATAVYTDVTCSDTARGVTVDDIIDSKKRGIFVATKVNVWRKSERFGYYI